MSLGLVAKRTPIVLPTTLMVTLLTLILLALVLAVSIRFQRGLLGLVFAGLAVGLGVYWMSYALKSLRKGPIGSVAATEDWKPDIIDMNDQLLVVGKVRLRDEGMRISVVDRVLLVEAGDGFKGRVILPTKAEASSFTYRNGILEVRLTKTTPAKPDAGRTT